jgi:hypothetical protein
MGQSPQRKGETGVGRSTPPAAAVTSLEGSWRVERISGLLPPLVPIRKRIGPEAGVTGIGPLRLPFQVEGTKLRYRRPLQAFVDELAPRGDGFAGRATFLGREYGRFRLVRE